VGSSLELAQRLDEPVPQWLLNATLRRRSFATDADDKPESMHLFDIRRTSDVLRTWRDIHAQTLSRSSFPRLGHTAAGTGLRNMAAVTNDSESSDARQRWVQYCDPPRLPAMGSSSKGTSNSGEIVNAPEVDLLSSRGSASLVDDSTNYLTKEGLRQVGSYTLAPVIDPRLMLIHPPGPRSR
jgi:hypothetical protein